MKDQLSYIGTIRTLYIGKTKKENDKILLEDAVEVGNKLEPMQVAMEYVQHGIEGKLQKYELNSEHIESVREAPEETNYVCILDNLAKEAEKKFKSESVIKQLAKIVSSMDNNSRNRSRRLKGEDDE